MTLEFPHVSSKAERALHPERARSLTPSSAPITVQSTCIGGGNNYDSPASSSGFLLMSLCPVFRPFHDANAKINLLPRGHMMSFGHIKIDARAF